jgi:hypothetical protein
VIAESTSGRLDLSFSLVTEAEVAPDVVSGDLESLVAFVLASEGAIGAWEITVALVDDARLQSLHRDFMGIDTPTDIMTFPADESAGGVKGVGDLDRSRYDAGGGVGTLTGGGNRFSRRPRSSASGRLAG